MSALVHLPAMEKLSLPQTVQYELEKDSSPPPPNLPVLHSSTSTHKPVLCSKTLHGSALEGAAAAQLSVAELAVLAMDLPYFIVQMARDFFQLQNHTNNLTALKLFEAAEDLLNDKEKQARVKDRLTEAAEEREKAGKIPPPDGLNWSSGKGQDGEGSITEEACVSTLSAEMPKRLLLDSVPAVGDKAKKETEPAPITTSITSTERKAELKGKVQTLARKNHRLRQRQTCRKCRQMDLASSGVTFLPCGHFITCEACSETCDNCPACGRNIMGTVRTFLS